MLVIRVALFYIFRRTLVLGLLEDSGCWYLCMPLICRDIMSCSLWKSSFMKRKRKQKANDILVLLRRQLCLQGYPEREPSGLLAHDFWEPQSEWVVGRAWNLAFLILNLYSFHYIVLAFHGGKTDARSLLNGITRVSPMKAFLEKADAVAQRYQKSVAFETGRLMVRCSPTFSSFTLSLLPFLLSLWQSNTDVKSRFALNAWGKRCLRCRSLCASFGS